MRAPATTARAWRDDVGWLAVVALPGAVVLAWLVLTSPRAAVSLVIIVFIVGLHQTDRRWGIAALFAFWFLAPELRRIIDLMVGYAGNDPLSVAPFVATGLVGGIEFFRSDLPPQIRRTIMVAAAGFTIGLPLGLLHPRSGLYAFGTYLCCLGAAALGANEPLTLRGSTFRRVLLFGAPLVAVYGIVAQRLLPLPHWQTAWLDAVDFNSIGADSHGHVRLFSTVNAPGTLSALLGLSLLAYLSIKPRSAWVRNLALLSGVILAVALDLTFVRSAWLALVIGAVAHVIASRGRSARLVFSVAAVVIVATLALAPVNPTAKDVLTRATTFGALSSDPSVTNRRSTLNDALPRALPAPGGHGLGTAGQPSLLNTSQSDLAIPDDGYLALLYQVGPAGFVLVVAALARMLRAAWLGARRPGPTQEMGVLVFAMFVFLLVILASGDSFYGFGGAALWFVGGQALAFEYRRAPATAGEPARMQAQVPRLVLEPSSRRAT